MAARPAQRRSECRRSAKRAQICAVHSLLRAAARLDGAADAPSGELSPRRVWNEPDGSSRSRSSSRSTTSSNSGAGTRLALGAGHSAPGLDLSPGRGVDPGMPVESRVTDVPCRGRTSSAERSETCASRRSSSDSARRRLNLDLVRHPDSGDGMSSETLAFTRSSNPEPGALS